MTANNWTSPKALGTSGVNIEPIRERSCLLPIGGILGDTVDEEITNSRGGGGTSGPNLPVGLGPVGVTSVEGETVGRSVASVPVILHGVDRCREEVELEELVTE